MGTTSLEELHNAYKNGERRNYSQFFKRGFDHETYLENLSKCIKAARETYLEEIFDTEQEILESAYQIETAYLEEAGVLKSDLER